MPELPEVETIVNDLRKKIVGRKITGVWFDIPKLRGKFPEKQIKGLKIVDVKRRGKNILIYLDSKILLIHQKMTGHLLYGKWKITKVSIRQSADKSFKVVSLIKGALEEKVNNYIHFILYLDNDWQVGLSDLRKFAKILFGGKDEIENLADLKNLGPEPLDANFKFVKFVKLIKTQKRKIKQVLMDQNVIAGIGNIYSDEILWQAKIHPFRKANELRVNELKNLYIAMKEILIKAVKLRGTSVSDFRDAFGKSGGYAKIRKVYRRENESCPRCGSMIKRIKIGGRSAHYCSQCQKI
ncbi:MAG: bifunctional DNA-formamidopyrimidine glycosylase/DNA-(apurinic or apyrimidinic site) lyase [Patescibacteria group bacterium]|nr:bifunctional DNA-formamidopyrimidine glycosylase/DNA-(apurinic or apyrimidinic site) lyase [Patescibacteria group bacterium]